MNAKHGAASLLLLLLGVVLAGCGGTPVTPTPAGSSAPTLVPTPDPSADASAGASATARLDPSPSPTAAASGLPAGWQHELVCREDRYSGCGLHLHDAAGQDRSGWPTPLLAGWCSPDNVAVGTDGVAYVACTTEDERTVVSSFAVTGSARPGWPVEATGQPAPGSGDSIGIGVGPDGTVYVGTTTGADGRGFSIHAFEPDGRPRPGWPRTLPGVAQRFSLAPDGIVVGWWYEGVKTDTLDVQAARTKYTMIGPSGRTLPGWPVTSIGTATAPAIAQDGSIFYTSATAKVWGHDRSGQIIDGWPYQLPERVAPELRPDGRLMFILGGWTADDGTGSDSEVIVLTTAGRVASGWPYRTSASLDGPQCCADCNWHFPHAVSADGTMYIAPWDEDGAEVVALDGRGRVVTGWPYRLPPGSRVAALEVGSAGQLVVGLRDCSAQSECCNEDATRKITLTPAGELVSPGPTPIPPQPTPAGLTLNTPTTGATVIQNDPSTGCPSIATRGHGFSVASRGTLRGWQVWRSTRWWFSASAPSIRRWM